MAALGGQSVLAFWGCLMNSRFSVSSAGIPPRGRQRSQRFLIATCVLCLLAFSSVASAIEIVGGTNGPFTFDDQPTTADWTALTLSGGNGDIADLAALTARVQQQTAAGISSALRID